MNEKEGGRGRGTYRRTANLALVHNGLCKPIVFARDSVANERLLHG